MLFELETSVLPDEKIVGRVKWALHGIRAICYVFIVYAFYGYLTELFSLYQVELIGVSDACALLGADWSLLLRIVTTLSAGLVGLWLFRAIRTADIQFVIETARRKGPTDADNQ